MTILYEEQVVVQLGFLDHRISLDLGRCFQEEKLVDNNIKILAIITIIKVKNFKVLTLILIN
jgi:hypothetical protein